MGYDSLLFECFGNGAALREHRAATYYPLPETYPKNAYAFVRLVLLGSQRNFHIIAFIFSNN